MRNINVRIDRVQLVSWAKRGRKPPDLKGFKVIRDSFVRSQTTTHTYSRCRQYHSLTNRAKIFWQYFPSKGWLKRWKVTIVGDDYKGLTRNEIERVLKHCRHYRFLLVEVAIDFTPEAGINEQFIRGHAVFGKSRHRAKKIPKFGSLLR